MAMAKKAAPKKNTPVHAPELAPKKAVHRKSAPEKSTTHAKAEPAVRHLVLADKIPLDDLIAHGKQHIANRPASVPHGDVLPSCFVDAVITQVNAGTVDTALTGPELKKYVKAAFGVK